jgi:hypothetical protein
MKNLKLIIVICIAIFLNACNKDNDDNATNATLNGTWKLVKVTGDFVGSVSAFPEGVISWQFDEATKKVTVTNNNTDPTLADILQTGTYNYVTIDNANTLFCEKSITINDVDLGCMIFIEGNLKLDKSFLDGPKLEFIR